MLETRPDLAPAASRRPEPIELFSFPGVSPAAESGRSTARSDHTRPLRSGAVGMAEQEAGTMNRKLFVGNLSFSTEERTLEELFGQAGNVTSVRVMRDQATGRARGFGFVEMETEEAAQSAIDKFNNQEVDGRRIAVNEARPQVPGGQRFGGGGGGDRGRGGDRGGFGNRRREARW